MSDAYSNIVGGGLKLKGIKKKKRSSGSDTALALAAEAAAQAAAPAEASSSSTDMPFVSTYTDTEKRRLETMEKRKMDLAKEGKLKTHREQVKDFNAYLGKLTEHYDLPKVSKGN